MDHLPNNPETRVCCLLCSLCRGRTEGTCVSCPAWKVRVYRHARSSVSLPPREAISSNSSGYFLQYSQPNITTTASFNDHYRLINWHIFTETPPHPWLPSSHPCALTSHSGAPTYAAWHLQGAAPRPPGSQMEKQVTERWNCFSFGQPGRSSFLLMTATYLFIFKQCSCPIPNTSKFLLSSLSLLHYFPDCPK